MPNPAARRFEWAVAALALLAGCLGNSEPTETPSDPTPTPAPPVVQGHWDEGADKFDVSNVSPANASWSDLLIAADKAGISFHLSGAAAASDPDVPTGGRRVSATHSVIDASDYLAFCGDSGDVTVVAFRLLFEPSGDVVRTWMAQSVGAC